MLTIKLIFHCQVRQKRVFFFPSRMEENIRNESKNSEFVFNFLFYFKKKRKKINESEI